MLQFDVDQSDAGETAAFALGCFWGPDARFGVTPGVVTTRAGYAGGDTTDPTYHDLDGHSETVQIEYDPDTVSYKELLQVAWQAHNPYRQPFRTQYKHIIFVEDREQRDAAQTSKEEQASQAGKPVKTVIEPFDRFHPAEPYHQKYFLRQHEPVLAAFQEGYTDTQLRESTAAARVNGFLAGYGTQEHVEDVVSQLPFPDTVTQTIKETHQKQRRSLPEKVKTTLQNLF